MSRKVASSLRYSVGVILPGHWLGRVRYHLLEPIHVGGMEIPTGFVTDGATVPRPFWLVFPPVGRYFAAAAAHDYALYKGFRWRSATRVFASALDELGVAGWRRFLLVNAVRLHGVCRGLRHIR